jgi:hypothetical protein
MRLRFLRILAAGAMLVVGANGAMGRDVAGIAIPEPASVALLGAALLSVTKLLRKRLRS